MIKGVNKKIIEVKTDSVYFEKAVFYLRPCVRKLPEEVSREETARFVSMIVPDAHCCKRFPFRLLAVSLLLLITAGAFTLLR